MAILRQHSNSHQDILYSLGSEMLLRLSFQSKTGNLRCTVRHLSLSFAMLAADWLEDLFLLSSFLVLGTPEPKISVVLACR